MKYFKFIPTKINSDSDKNNHSYLWNQILYRLLSILIPKANPDFEYKYVSIWYVEYDDKNNYINREIGLNKEGKVIVKAPYKKNLGLWTDSNATLGDFEKWSIEDISPDIFNNFWEQGIYK